MSMPLRRAGGARWREPGDANAANFVVAAADSVALGRGFGCCSDMWTPIVASGLAAALESSFVATTPLPQQAYGNAGECGRGRMLRLTRKRLSGSWLFLTLASRSMFPP